MLILNIVDTNPHTLYIDGRKELDLHTHNHTFLTS